ncbi:MAG: hypothetical protein PEGG_01042 [Paraeggerthella hongkongensis]|uniref:delta-aminolevulinic acid dehydratase n=1 Tax=Paraeggerthella TaxID=651554 RepID=UPI000DF76135|nr:MULTISPECIES: delta-aminolevulinic acid dehydratase [Paraeggerthella]MBU5404748.1 delta-aminolevulinic acid dehydratase [Paraeggerthella hongkongensis]MCD2433264.1 delta-aminolevulinic acid dehydratase [Paraeggerthella hominis]MDY3982001.1 delta-aminolevulinic acid dehydratase [Paraeggerthella sp.]RDB59149.1 delta-aminolevulinic acid dehydratase [Paraeggerthella hongkongensis]
MNVAVLEKPQAIKISSKRQITIPAKIYEKAGFGDYALCTWTDKGMFLQPLEVEDEDVTVDILRHLISEGYEGEELIEQYCSLKKKVVSVRERVEEAERDIEEGRYMTYEDMRAGIRNEYGF